MRDDQRVGGSFGDGIEWAYQGSQLRWDLKQEIEWSRRLLGEVGGDGEVKLEESQSG